MNCRIGCGACCIAPSISSPIPGMPSGKPAGTRCVNLSDDFECRIWGTPHFPKVCQNFSPEIAVCGTTRAEALTLLGQWESMTAPA